MKTKSNMLKERIKTISICILFLIICIMAGILYKYSNKNFCNIKSDYAGDKETAIKIAQAVYKAKTGQEYTTDEFYIDFDTENNEWHIYTSAEDVPDDNLFVLDYYGLYINADTGSITKMGLKGE